MKILRKVLVCAISLFLVSIIVVNFTLVIKSETNKNEIPDFAGYTPFVIATGSMEPQIKVNDIIITKKIKNENSLKVGDIISYRSKTDDIVITHRIYEIKNEDGKKYYIMKGDNNNQVDGEEVEFSNIVGKYRFMIPGVGFLVTYLKSPLGMVMVIGVILLIYVIFDIIDRLFRKNDLDEIKKQIEKEYTDNPK